MKNLFLIALVSFGSLIMAQEAQFLDIDGVEIKDNVVQFGEVEKGGKAVQVVVIKNTGDQPLLITRAQPTCGCTVPSYPKEPIAPGEAAEMEIKYNSTTKVGKFSKSVTVYTNSKENERVIIRIKGEITDPNAIVAQEEVKS